MSRPYGVPSPFRYLRADDIQSAEEEPPLVVRDYALTYLYAFDLGSAWLVRINPRRVVERLVTLGYAVASTTRAEKQRRIEIAGLLDMFRDWDSRQISTYVKQGRFARAIFPPLQIKMPHDKELRSAQIVTSIHSSGVACLILHLAPRKNPEKLNTDETLELLERVTAIQVEVTLPEEIKEVVEHSMKMLRFSDKWKNLGDSRYEATLEDVFTIVVHAIYIATLDTLDLNRDDEDNYRFLHLAGAFAYPMLYVLAGNDSVAEPFREVVAKHPRQCCALLLRQKRYETNVPEVVVSEFVNISRSVRSSWAFTNAAMLRIEADSRWKERFGNSDGYASMIVPRSVLTIADTACFEIICALRQLLDGYDLLLTRILLLGGVEELTRAEERIVRGLEEICQARHQIFGSVADWWWLAEERLGVAELNRAVNEKLTRTHEIIAAKAQQRSNTLMIYLTAGIFALTIFTALTAVPVIEQRVWPAVELCLRPIVNAITANPIVLALLAISIVSVSAYVLLKKF